MIPFLLCKKDLFLLTLYFLLIIILYLTNKIYISNTIKKKKFIDLYLSPDEFYNPNIFLHKINVLDKTYRYSLLFKVCFGTNPSYKMLGNQIGIDYISNQDITSLHLNLHDNLLFRLESSMLNYNFNGDEIVLIQVLAYKVEYSDVIHKKIDLGIESLGYHKDLIDTRISNINKVFNKVLPQTMDLSKYGNQLETKAEGGVITSITDKKNLIGFASLLKDNKDFILKDTTKIYPSDK